MSLRAAEADELRVRRGEPGRSLLSLRADAGSWIVEGGVGVPSPTAAHAPCDPAFERVVEVGDEVPE